MCHCSYYRFLYRYKYHEPCRLNSGEIETVLHTAGLVFDTSKQSVELALELIHANSFFVSQTANTATGA